MLKISYHQINALLSRDGYFFDEREQNYMVPYLMSMSDSNEKMSFIGSKWQETGILIAMVKHICNHNTLFLLLLYHHCLIVGG